MLISTPLQIQPASHLLICALPNASDQPFNTNLSNLYQTHLRLDVAQF